MAIINQRFLKHKFFIIMLTLLIGQELFSQSDSTHMARNTVYGEAFGNGGYGSINYERIVYTSKYLSFSLRFGFSTYNLKDYRNKFNPDVIIPLGIIGSYGKSHKIEWGIGETISNIAYADLTYFKPNRVTEFHTVLHAGYRYQKHKRGMFYRIVYTPFFEFNKFYQHWAGTSIGYTF